MSKQLRLPRKVKKWVKRSAHYVRMQGKLPVITYDGWGMHLFETAMDLTYIHKPKRRKL